MKKLFLGLLSLTMLFSACKKDEAGNLSIYIEGTVYDYKTSAAIEGATVQVTTGGGVRTATTDANGYFSLGNFATGDYRLIVKKGGYLTDEYWAYSSDITVTKNTENVTLNKIITIYPLSETVSFTLYKDYVENATSIVAANSPYTITFSGFGNTPRTGTSDAKGFVELDSIPYGRTCYISFDFEEDGIHYKGIASFSSTNFNSYLEIPGYDDNGEFALISSNVLDANGVPVEDFDTASTITFKFTQPVDTNDVKVYTWISNLDHEVSWSETNMLMTIDITDPMAEDTQYNVEFGVYNESHTQTLEKDIEFKTLK